MKFSTVMPILIFLAFTISGCVGASSGGSPLMHGLNEGGTANAGVASSQNAAEAATVVSVKGKVISICAGKSEQLTAGMRVPLNAILRSEAKGSAQLILPDQSKISLKPNSELVLADFAKAPEKEDGVLGFTKSMGRMFTGKNSSVAASKNTSQTSIGIRGLTEGN